MERILQHEFGLGKLGTFAAARNGEGRTAAAGLSVAFDFNLAAWIQPFACFPFVGVGGGIGVSNIYFILSEI